MLLAGFPDRRPEFKPTSGHMGFVVDKMALEHVSSEYFGFRCQFVLHRLFHTHNYQLLSWAGVIGKILAGVPS
jgi:hypothetical protein